MGETRGEMTDTERLDWLEEQMRPGSGYVEVYLAGLRNGRSPTGDPWDATSYQVESQPERWPVAQAPTLRAAIDAARVSPARDPHTGGTDG